MNQSRNRVVSFILRVYCEPFFLGGDSCGSGGREDVPLAWEAPNTGICHPSEGA